MSLETLYADPGYLSDGQEPRFPLRTVDEVRDAWDVLLTATEYDESQLQRVRAAVVAAATRFRIDLEDDADVLMVNDTLHQTINAVPETGRPSGMGAVGISGGVRSRA